MHVKRLWIRFHGGMDFTQGLTKPAGNVILGQLVAGGGEDLGRVANFDQLPEVEIGGALGDAGGLLHGVGDDGDGILLFELVDQVFDDGGGDGVEGAAGFVHQNDFGAHGNGAGNAQALLLATRQAGARLVHAVFDFLPQTGFAQGGLDDVVQFCFVLGQAMNARAVGHIVIDGFWEGVGFLEDHADLGPQRDHIDIFAVHIDAVQG